MAAIVPDVIEQQVHLLIVWAADLFGHDITHFPAWLHAMLHVVLILGPFSFLVVLTLNAVEGLRTWLRRGRVRKRIRRSAAPLVAGFERNHFRYVLRHTGRQQIVLIALGLASMPVLYATLELPKIIINNAIDSDHFPVAVAGWSLEQTDYLFALSGLYLAAILANGALKYTLNIRKGRVGERLLRRLRLAIYHRWRRGAGSGRRSEVIPIIAQEVEPIGGFAADAFALPVFQGGTFLTILLFMFMQDPVLGAAAVTLLPVQLALIPRLQRRVNRLARARVAEMRGLGGELGDQAAGAMAAGGRRIVGRSLKRIETIRLDLHRAKFFMKSLTNFLSSLTPFFFYAIGGYLVIEGRLSLGALVAVLAAYKDFSAPLRELFRYYQTAEDVRIRYREVLAFAAGGVHAQRCRHRESPRSERPAIAGACLIVAE